MGELQEFSGKRNVFISSLYNIKALTSQSLDINVYEEDIMF